MKLLTSVPSSVLNKCKLGDPWGAAFETVNGSQLSKKVPFGEKPMQNVLGFVISATVDQSLVVTKFNLLPKNISMS